MSVNRNTVKNFHGYLGVKTTKNWFLNFWAARVRRTLLTLLPCFDRYTAGIYFCRQLFKDGLSQPSRFPIYTKYDFWMTFALGLLELKNSCSVLSSLSQNGNLTGIDLAKLSIDLRII